VAGCRGGTAFLIESGNVGARHERLVACAAQGDDTQIAVGREAGKDLAGLPPHRQRYGVVTIRIAEDQMTDASLFSRQDFARFIHNPLRRRSCCLSSSPNAAHAVRVSGPSRPYECGIFHLSNPFKDLPWRPIAASGPLLLR